jgi:subtilisin-like proprotein convertase family protein
LALKAGATQIRGALGKRPGFAAFTVTDGAIPPQSYSNNASIRASDFTSATPYPSQITVSGLPTSIGKLTVTLLDLTHSWPDDLDILLVGPTGQSVLLVSDAGEGNAFDNVNLILDDLAISSLPDAGAIPSGSYRPSNHGNEADSFPQPAPGEPYGAGLAALNGTDPNGVWSLFIVDDEAEDEGILAGGWTLTISPAAAPPSIRTVSRQALLGSERLAESLPSPGVRLVAVQIAPLLLPDGTVSLGLRGEPNARYTLQVSADLIHWRDLTTNTLVEGMSEYLDREATVQASRFYRVVLRTD